MTSPVPPIQSLKHHLALIKTHGEQAEKDLWGAITCITTQLRVLNKRQVAFGWGLGLSVAWLTIWEVLCR